MWQIANGMMNSGRGVSRTADNVVEWHAGAFGVLGAVLGIILWALIVVALVLVIMTLIRTWRQPRTVVSGSAYSVMTPPVQPVTPAAQPGQAVTQSDALQVLEERYARGEINHDEYLERKRNLTAG